MKRFLLLSVLLSALYGMPVVAAEKIEDFLSLKFGSDRAAAKEAMVARGFKLKDEKAAEALTFQDGIYSGQPVKDLKLEFAGDKFSRAIVAFEVHSGKREECARLGLDAYDKVRKALTDKYGPPASTASVPRAKILADKTPQNTALKSSWRTAAAMNGANRSITFSTVTMALYSWVFNVVYEDASMLAAPGQTPPRKDI